MAVQTTFSMFQQLLKDSVDANSNLTTTLSVALKARVDAMSAMELVSLTATNVDSTVGNVAVDETTNSIVVSTGAPPVENRVIFDMATFATPVRVSGTYGEFGAVLGHDGSGANDPVASADITLYYRYATTASWVIFNRQTVLDEVSTLQMSAVIATQAADADMPQMHLVAEQL